MSAIGKILLQKSFRLRNARHRIVGSVHMARKIQSGTGARTNIAPRVLSADFCDTIGTNPTSLGTETCPLPEERESGHDADRLSLPSLTLFGRCRSRMPPKLGGPSGGKLRTGFWPSLL